MAVQAQIRDIAFAGGELVFRDGDLATVSGADAIVQDIACRLAFFRGEWFLAPDEGVPWFERVLVKNPNPALVRSTIRDALLSTPGVLDVLELSIRFDAAARNLAVTYRVSTDLGEIQGAI